MKTKCAILFAVLLQAATVSGSIVYSGIQNIAIPDTFGGVYIDFTNSLDATAFTTSFSEPANWDINPFFGGASVGTSDTFTPVTASAATNADLVNLSVGDLVSSTSVFPSGFSGSTGHMGAGATQFQNNTTGYIGFSLNPATDNYKGWMSVVFRDDGSVGSIQSWAWDTSGADIQVGAIPEPAAGIVLLLLIGVAVSYVRPRRSIQAN